MEFESTLSTILTEEALCIIEVQPGDVLILKHPGRLAGGKADAIRVEVAALLPGVKVLILDDGLALDSVLRYAK